MTDQNIILLFIIVLVLYIIYTTDAKQAMLLVAVIALPVLYVRSMQPSALAPIAETMVSGGMMQTPTRIDNGRMIDSMFGDTYERKLYDYTHADYLNAPPEKHLLANDRFAAFSQRQTARLRENTERSVRGNGEIIGRILNDGLRQGENRDWWDEPSVLPANINW